MASGVLEFLDRKKPSESTEEIGIGGFLLTARVLNTSNYTSKVPSTVLEDGSVVSDHIILNPLTLNISGFVSDIFLQSSPFDKILKRAQTAIGIISLYIPAKTASQLQNSLEFINEVTNRIDGLNADIANGKQLLSLFGLDGTGGSATIQESFVSAMESLHFGKQLISIDMPFRRHNNMRIDTVNISRDNTLNALSYSIKATQVRFAETKFADSRRFFMKPSPALDDQTAVEKSNGVQEGRKLAQAEAERARENFVDEGVPCFPGINC